MRLNCAIFDMDGTLLDSMDCWRSLNLEYVLSLGITPTKKQREEMYNLSGSLIIPYLKREFGVDAEFEPLLKSACTAIEAHYRRGLQMTDAEAFARWHYGEARSLRRCFVSQADGAVWFSIEEDHPRTLELTLTPTTQVTQHPLLEEIKNNAELKKALDAIGFSNGGEQSEQTE